MRFTRYSATILFVLSIGGVVIIGIVYFGIIPFPADTLVLQVAYAFLLALPFIIAPIGFLIVYSARHSLHFTSHLPDREGTQKQQQQQPPAKVNREDDALTHLAVGLLVALLQDFSLGRVLNRELYAPEFLALLETELQFYNVYIDRGFLFHFHFHHDKPHQAFIRYRVSDRDMVVEVDGLFDYYFERNGQKHAIPNEEDTRPPLLQIPGVMRIRVQLEQSHHRWLLVGFSESVRGLRMGLATE